MGKVLQVWEMLQANVRSATEQACLGSDVAAPTAVGSQGMARAGWKRCMPWRMVKYFLSLVTGNEAELKTDLKFF